MVGQSGHSGEALYNILPAALSKHDKAWQDAEKARQLRSRLIEILNGDPAASLNSAARTDVVLLIRRTVRPEGTPPVSIRLRPC